MTAKEVLHNEIDKLPENIVCEVIDFVQFLKLKNENSSLTGHFLDLSQSSFNKVWNNPEDDIYDKL